MSGKAQYSRTEYVAAKPAFLQNFGLGSGGGGSASSSSRGGGRNERDLPSRPKDGQWARGSGDEASDEEKDEGDAWEQMYGGGEGPQVVVLREGKHLSADDVARERRRAKGLPSPPPEDKELKTDADKDEAVKGVADASRRPQARPTAKRKLVGDAVASKDKDNGKGKDGEKSKKKKKKAVKGLLSFDEAEGE